MEFCAFQAICVTKTSDCEENDLFEMGDVRFLIIRQIDHDFLMFCAKAIESPTLSLGTRLSAYVPGLALNTHVFHFIFEWN